MKKKQQKNQIWGIIIFMREKKSKIEKKASGILAKVILRIVTIVVIAAILLVGGYFGFKKFTTVKSENKVALVDKQLSFCQELVTAKYRYSDIITLKKTAGLAKSYSIIKYTGLVRVGIADFTDLTYSISMDGKSITLKVPQTEILGNELVSQSIFDEKRSIFVPITTQEIFDEIESAKTEAVEDMVAEGILDEARDYAVRIITQFMLALGFEEVKIQ